MNWIIYYTRKTMKSLTASSSIAMVLIVITILLSFSGCANENKTTINSYVPKEDASYYVNDSLYCDIADNSSIVTDTNTSASYYDGEIILFISPEADYSSCENAVSEDNGKIVGYDKYTNSVQVRYPGKKAELLNNLIEKYKSAGIAEVGYLNYAICNIGNALPSGTSTWPENEWSYDNPAGGNWGMEAIHAMAAWNEVDKMQSVNVGVFDGGFDTSVSDLRNVVIAERTNANVLYQEEVDMEKKDEIKGNIDHGNHVSGIIAADWNNTDNNNNPVGVAGVCPAAKLVLIDQYAAINDPENIEDPKLPTFYFIVAYSYLIGENHCRVVNMSLGSKDVLTFSATRGNKAAQDECYLECGIISYGLHRLLEAENDFVICVSAGNDNNNNFFWENNTAKYGYYLVKPDSLYARDDNFWDGVMSAGETFVYYDDEGNEQTHKITLSEALSKKSEIVYGEVEARWNSPLTTIPDKDLYDRIIVVGACGLSEDGGYSVSSFSNIGERVDVLAPGEDVESCISNNEYEKMPGTSMASPHVAGVAALLYSINPSIDGEKVKEIIVSSADIAVQGSDKKMVNAEAAVNEALLSIADTEEYPSNNSLFLDALKEMSLTAFNGWSYHPIAYAVLDIDGNGKDEIVLKCYWDEEYDKGEHERYEYAYAVVVINDDDGSLYVCNNEDYEWGNPATCRIYKGKLYFSGNTKSLVSQEDTSYAYEYKTLSGNELIWLYNLCDEQQIYKGNITQLTEKQYQACLDELVPVTFSSFNEEADPDQKLSPLMATDVVYEHKVDSDLNEYAIITGVTSEGEQVWQLETDHYIMAQYSAVGSLGCRDKMYYYYDGEIKAISIKDGSLVWYNQDTYPPSDAAIDNDGTMYVCCYEGLDFCAIDRNGNTLKRIVQLSSDSLWPDNIQVEGDRIRITETYNGPNGKVFYIDKKTFAVSAGDSMQKSAPGDDVPAQNWLLAKAQQILQQFMNSDFSLEKLKEQEYPDDIYEVCASAKNVNFQEPDSAFCVIVSEYTPFTEWMRIYNGNFSLAMKSLVNSLQFRETDEFDLTDEYDLLEITTKLGFKRSPGQTLTGQCENNLALAALSALSEQRFEACPDVMNKKEAFVYMKYADATVFVEFYAESEVGLRYIVGVVPGSRNLYEWASDWYTMLSGCSPKIDMYCSNDGEFTEDIPAVVYMKNGENQSNVNDFVRYVSSDVDAFVKYVYSQSYFSWFTSNAKVIELLNKPLDTTSDGQITRICFYSASDDTYMSCEQIVQSCVNAQGSVAIAAKNVSTSTLYYNAPVTMPADSVALVYYDVGGGEEIPVTVVFSVVDDVVSAKFSFAYADADELVEALDHYFKEKTEIAF